LSIGASWTALTQAQRQQLDRELRALYLGDLYRPLASYAGQRLEVTNEQPAPSGVMVRSQIIKANGEPVKIDYLMRRSGDS
jgi:phospholipid transport system substrate-binding protein